MPDQPDTRSVDDVCADVLRAWLIDRGYTLPGPDDEPPTIRLADALTLLDCLWELPPPGTSRGGYRRACNDARQVLTDLAAIEHGPNAVEEVFRRA